MAKLSFKYSVGFPVIWSYEGRRCIVRSHPGVWNGTDYIWYVSEIPRVDFAFAVPESDLKPLEFEPAKDQ